MAGGRHGEKYLCGGQRVESFSRFFLANCILIYNLQKMIRRTIEGQVRASLSEAPAVLLVGARQVGKTTLARSMKGIYFDLEKESDRLRLDLYRFS